MINDKYSNLPISRQAKWALRNPDKVRAAKEKYKESPKYKAWVERTRQQRIERARQFRKDHPDYYKKRSQQ